MRKLLALAVAWSASAQVSVRYTPEPMVIPAAVLSSARDLGRYEITACNDGPANVTLPWERIDMAAGDIRFIDPGDALLVLAGHQRQTATARIVKYGSIAVQGLSIGLAFASKANLRWSTGLSIGASVAPAFIQIAAGQVPSITPLDSSIRYPVTMEPGACYTDHRFAAKMRNARVHTAVIQAGGSPVRPIQKSAIEAILSGCVTVYEDGVVIEDTCRHGLSAKLDVRYSTP